MILVRISALRVEPHRELGMHFSGKVRELLDYLEQLAMYTSLYGDRELSNKREW